MAIAEDICWPNNENKGRDMRYLLVVLLAGCASTSAVTPYGADFLVTATDGGGATRRNELEVMAVSAANGHCAKLGKKMAVKSSTTSGNRWTGSGARLVFACE